MTISKKHVPARWSVLATLLLMVSCTHMPPVEESLKVGPKDDKRPSYQWETKATIKNLETKEEQTISLDVVGQKPSPLRFEVGTSLGIALASIVVKGNQIEIMLPKQKKYYSGPMSERALKPVLNIELDPKVIMGALFGESYPEWSCRADNGVIAECDTPSKVHIAWTFKNGDEKQGKEKITLTGKGFEVEILVKTEHVRDTVKPDYFSLKMPESFKRFRLLGPKSSSLNNK